MNRRIASLVLACLLALPLTACGDATADLPDGPGDGSSERVPVTMLYTMDLTNFEALVEQACPGVDL